MNQDVSKENVISRRGFLRNAAYASAGAAAVSQFPYIITGHAEPDDVVRVGVIGCGGRGTGAALNVLRAGTQVVYPQKGYHTESASEGTAVGAKNVVITALADVFEDRLQNCNEQLAKVGMKVDKDHCFTGFDAYKKLLALDDVNYIIHATPPQFRPAQVLAAVEAGKNVFMEKPAAVDPHGIRLIMKAGKLAKEKGLGIVAGTQRRHQAEYVETIKKIHDGAIGDLVELRAYWNQGYIWVIEKQPGWSDMEWQIRNWNYFTWLSGDHIVEQHLHNLDVCNWVADSHPIRATSLGGRQVRVQPIFGNVYDHFATEYEYPSGMRMFSQCRQINGCTNNVSEFALGKNGSSNCSGLIEVQDGDSWRFRGRRTNPYEQEHVDLINSIRRGEPLNEAQNVAESTLTAIMGRLSAYSGRTVTWEEALNADLNLSPDKLTLGDLPVSPVAMPGKYDFS
ncbi:MAG: Gfo/Idh/MocA family oxidoreductase [Verrucomicrobia bacterium]|nr:Gfo/Idh/MocA family oxidoreductase [Verrucomicrobiota bacterium]MCF7708970.1 Gfo/Idh/MocA family oxidoreductase [Verrucomicrobiota bacterium]